MSIEGNKAVIHRFISEYERHEMESAWKNFDPHCKFPVLRRFGIEPTFENYKVFMTDFLKALPNIHHSMEGMVAEGNNVWVNWTIRGTHEGPLRKIPATYKDITYSVISMYRVANDKIIETDFLADDLSLLRQLGALPS